MAEELEARLGALTDLVVATIVALDSKIPGRAESAVRVAQSLRQVAFDHGDGARAEALDTLLDTLRDALRLAVNDG